MASKTIAVNINGVVFHMAEAAYAAFEDYLKSVKKYFSKHEGKEEIIADLEGRIAEHFSEKISPKKQVLLKKDIEDLIKIMGQVEDFEAEEKGEEENSVPKRLYRDRQNAILAGVCSGLSLYFNVDVRLIRLLFFLSIFAGGIGILTYGLLWIFVPEAKTTAEKEEMAGHRFDLAAIAKEVEEKVGNIKIPEGVPRKIGALFKTLGQGVTALVKFLLRAMLFLLRLASVFAVPALILLMAAFTLVIFALAFDLYPYFIYLPLDALDSQVSLHIFLIGIYVAGMAPFIALLFALFSPLKRKWLLTVSKGVVLMGLFLTGALMAGLGAVDMVPRLQKGIEDQLKSELKVAQKIELEPFDEIWIDGLVRQATILSGEEYSAEIRTDERCQEMFGFQVVNHTRYQPAREDRGALHLSQLRPLPYNPFCEAWGVDLVITAPDFEFLNASGNPQVELRGFDLDKLEIDLFGGARLEMVQGQAEDLEVSLHDRTQLHALLFEAKKASINASGFSMAELWATDSLQANLQQESSVHYKGSPELSIQEQWSPIDPLDSTRVRKVEN